MMKSWIAGAAFALASLPGAATAQDGAKLDCVVAAATPALKAEIGASMTGPDDAPREALLKQLGAMVDDCAARHGIASDNKGDYLAYNIARIAREWLIGEIARSKLQASVVDKALDFGPRGANPDLTGEMTEDHINTILQAYVAAGVDIESIDQPVWEKVGAYAAATSIYWNKRKRLPF